MGLEWRKRDIRSLSEGEYQRYYSMMAEEKRLRIDRFRRPEDRKLSVAAEMLARQAAAARCGCPEEELVFEPDGRGKPCLRGRGVEISLSHAGNLAVCALSDRPVGIDVERIQPIHLGAARKIFTPEEQEELFGRPPAAEDFVRSEDPVLLDRFFRLWTRAEAYGKCSGEGIFTSEIPRRPSQGFWSIREGAYWISVYQQL